MATQDQHQSPFSVYQGKTCILILPGKPRHLFMTWKIKFKMIIQIIDSLRGSMDLIIFLKQNIKIYKDTHKDNCLYFLKLVGRTGTALWPFENPSYLNDNQVVFLYWLFSIDNLNLINSRYQLHIWLRNLTWKPRILRYRF